MFDMTETKMTPTNCTPKKETTTTTTTTHVDPIKFCTLFCYRCVLSGYILGLS